MRITGLAKRLASSVLVFGLTLVAPARVLAHCDGLDGPVVKAAQKALDTGNPALVLIWVQAKDEPEIRTAIEHAVAVRACALQKGVRVQGIQTWRPGRGTGTRDHAEQDHRPEVTTRLGTGVGRQRLRPCTHRLDIGGMHEG